MNATLHAPEVMTAGERVVETGRRLVPYLLVIPGLVLVLGVLGYAVAGGFVLSLNETDMFLNKTFVGLKNYIAIVQNPRFQNSLWRTLAFVVLSIGLGITLSMVFALTLHHVGFGRRFFRGLSLVPYFVSGIAAAVMFRFIFTTSGGFVNYILTGIGLPAPSWLGDPTLAFTVSILANAWFMVPFATLILLGGLQTVDKDIYEAAKLDGSSGLHTFRRITLPLIKPMMGVSLIWISYISFSTFDIILALTGGRPGPRHRADIALHVPDRVPRARLRPGLGPDGDAADVQHPPQPRLSLVLRLRRPPLPGREVNPPRATDTVTVLPRW